MNRRYVILYWLLLLVPTFVISAFLFQTLRQERSRIVQAAYDTARDRAQTIAETIRLTTRGVEHTIIQALLLLPADDRLQEMLIGFVRTTDLVNNVFIWSHDAGLLYPVAGEGATVGDKNFVERYRPLFTGHVSWESARDAARQDPLTSSSVTDNSLLASLPNPPQGNGTAPTGTGGWIPWFADNRQSILGWVQREPNGIIYGAQLDLTSLLYWLINYFPDTAPAGMEYALLDGKGEILYQTGTGNIESGLEPHVTVPLSPYLPHWQVATYVLDPPLTEQSGQSFFLLSVLLLAIFVTAIILGGSLLTWQTHRNMVSAQQKTSFVSNVSHELKTPLTSIRMFAELLQEDRIKDPTKKAHYLKVIVAESQRLTRLVNNVLDFSRLEQGRKQYQLKEIEISGYLRYILETQRLRVQEAGMVLDNRIPESEYKVQSDKDAVEQVLLNLLDNAIKYAAEGEQLTVDLTPRNDQLQVRVMDRGPGVPAKHRSRIFEKFHRVDSSLTSRHPGSGLGLSIARTIMRDINGDLLYEPREGGGSCFTVLIPFQKTNGSNTNDRGAVSA
jgi:signal transduction histidine kinase